MHKVHGNIAGVLVPEMFVVEERLLELFGVQPPWRAVLVQALSVEHWRTQLRRSTVLRFPRQ
jgi:hypothetical protein